MQEGVALPPVTVVVDGRVLWLADGFHRALAAEKLGLKNLEAEVHLGSKIDALRISLQANAKHGRARSEKDLQNDRPPLQWTPG
jgi:ParB-like chromosome segregation protein Spo0J